MEGIGAVFILFLLVMNPLGNLPVFVAELEGLESNRYLFIVFRESLIALGILSLFFLCGAWILRVLQISKASLELSGGIILFLIALKLVFNSGKKDSSEAIQPHEPLIVPLAVPLFAGPAAISTAVLVAGRTAGVEAMFENMLALFAAWSICMCVLLCGRIASKIFGDKMLTALESLAGLLLTTIACGMMITGIRLAFKLH